MSVGGECLTVAVVKQQLGQEYFAYFKGCRKLIITFLENASDLRCVKDPDFE
jgi:hypothetical protein